MLFLDSTPNVAPITDLILTWTHIGQALVGSIGALAFIFALPCTPITLLPRLRRSVSGAGADRVNGEAGVCGAGVVLPCTPPAGNRPGGAEVYG